MDYFGFDNQNNQSPTGYERFNIRPPQNNNGHGKGSVVTIGILMCILVIAAGILSVLLTSYLTADKLTAQVTAGATEQVLTEYARQYYLPAEYSDDTLSVVSQTVNSVVIITSTYISGGKAYTSSGSGFVVNADGYVVTNAHVVTQDGIWNADIKISFYGSTTQYSTRILTRGCDTERDLAYIQLEAGVPAEMLRPVTFGDSDAVVMGERAVVIGNAGGLGISVTSGVISRQSASLEGTSYGETKVIQTDAAVNPGNSGGPLFNYFGHCIGVVSFKLASSDTAKYEGLGFAVAASEILNYLTTYHVAFTDNIA